MSFRRSIRSASILFSAVCSAAMVNAAEDDRIVDGKLIDGQIERAVVPVQRVRIVRFGDVSPEANAAQMLAQRDQQLMVFLDKINAECSLSDEQMQKATLAGKRDVRQLGSRRFGIFLDRPSPLFGTDFITTDSLVYKVLMTQLTPEQRQKFESLRDREMKATIFKSLK